MLNVDTELIASAAMGWLRFGKQFSFVAREAGMFSSDVLGSNTQTVTEIEIKVSTSDFRNDWKKHKHEVYKELEHKHTRKWPSGLGETSWLQTIPNQFYFACPAWMKEFAIEQVKEHEPKYGVIVMGDNTTNIHDPYLWNRLRVVKRAKFLHREKPSSEMLIRLAARMASDLANLHLIRRMDKDWVKMAMDSSKAFCQQSDIEKKEKLK